MNESIIITIDQQGNPTVEVENGNGASCSTLTKSIQNALGETVADAKLPEFYQTAKVQTNVKR